MTTKYSFNYSIGQLEQNEIAEKLLVDWASKQDRADWLEHGYCPGVQNNPNTLNFVFYIVTRAGLTINQIDEIIKILRDQGSVCISTHIGPTPRK